ncbi:MAG: DKNYY domain-containing protein, partial [Fulvivirga sp.]|nr:DKNYY domain-containing protein [Fulvivirga sp.]
DPRYGRDDRYVYYKFHPIPGADILSFEILSNHSTIKYSKVRLHDDKKVVVATGTGLARDKDHLYWGQHILEGYNPNEVELVNSNHIRYAGNIYKIINHKNVILIE